MILNPYLKLLVILLLCIVLLSGFYIGLSFADDFDVDLEDNDHEDHGLLGGFFNFVGDVIAFPFRLVGGVFDAIF